MNPPLRCPAKAIRHGAERADRGHQLQLSTLESLRVHYALHNHSQAALELPTLQNQTAALSLGWRRSSLARAGGRSSTMRNTTPACPLGSSWWRRCTPTGPRASSSARAASPSRSSPAPGGDARHAGQSGAGLPDAAAADSGWRAPRLLPAAAQLLLPAGRLVLDPGALRPGGHGSALQRGQLLHAGHLRARLPPCLLSGNEEASEPVLGSEGRSLTARSPPGPCRTPPSGDRRGRRSSSRT